MAENDYLKTNPTPNADSTTSKGVRVGSYYSVDDQDFPAPKAIKVKDKQGGGEEEFKGTDRVGKPSIFNRYSIFFFNNTTSNAKTPEDYYDKPNRLGDPYLEKIRKYPTAANLIEWSRSGNTNAVEYAWEDFLWCKNYGIVPNNYMVTLRRFTLPPEDDLFSSDKNINPDISRMITWVDGETNKWESVGLKWSHNLNFKELTADLQEKEAQPGYGNEAGAAEGLPFGGIVKSIMSISDSSASQASRNNNPASNSFNPYENSSVIFGPIDKVIKMQIRDKGLDFTQDINLVFEYQLRSVDGINPKIAMMDLLSNVMICTMNRGTFWGGDIRYYGGNPRRLKPIGDADKLRNGDYKGYFDSLVSGISGRLDSLTGGKGFSLEGIASAAKSLGGNLLSQIAGGALDKMGRPGLQAINSLLSGESTGEWHLTVGNPANPIISIGNLILKKTDVELFGPLGNDDFPSHVKVTCSLSPARPRDRTEIMGMFSRNGRTYLTAPPKAVQYTGNRPFGGYQGKKQPRGQEKRDTFKPEDLKDLPRDYVTSRFPNHTVGGRESNIEHSAKNIF
jgi:hypothetical protein